MKKPTLIVVCGPNGAGKTSITHKILNHKWIENSIYINPDEITNNLFGDWNSLESIIKAANYAKELREKCIAKGESFIFETVLAEKLATHTEEAPIATPRGLSPTGNLEVT